MRIRVVTDPGATPFVVMFEPSGMIYEVAPGESMTAELHGQVLDEMQIVKWEGGVSIWPPGSVTTFDARGNELHRLP